MCPGSGREALLVGWDREIHSVWAETDAAKKRRLTTEGAVKRSSADNQLAETRAAMSRARQAAERALTKTKARRCVNLDDRACGVCGRGVSVSTYFYGKLGRY